MLPSDDAKIQERDQLKAPVRPVKQRRLMRWDSTTQHSNAENKYKFDRCSFSLAMPNFNTLLDSLKICLPLTFEFRDAYLRKIKKTNIAPKAWCNNILQRLAFRINGEELVQFPEDGLHARVVWEYASLRQRRLADSGSLFPLVKASGHHRSDLRNPGFEHRQKQFASGRQFNTKTKTVNGLVVSDQFENGWEYKHVLEITPDLAAWQAFSRKVMKTAVDAGSYIFEADIELTFRADVESNGAHSDADSRLKNTPFGDLTRHDSIWREAFQIGQPMVEQLIEFQDDEPQGVQMPVDETCLLANAVYAVHGPNEGAKAGNHSEVRLQNDGDNTITTPGATRNATHTMVRWTPRGGFSRANIFPGDIIVFANADGNFYNDLYRKSQEKISWVFIKTITDLADDAGEGHSFEITHDALTGGNPIPTPRNVRIFPAPVIDDFQQCARWKIGDLLRFTDSNHANTQKMDVKVLGFNDNRRRLLVDRPIAHSTSAVLSIELNSRLGARSEIRNLYAAYGGMSIPISSDDDVGGVPGDYNNTVNGSVGAGVAGAGVVNNAVNRGIDARRHLRLDYLPKGLYLMDGDVIRIKQLDLKPRPDGVVRGSYQGQFQVITDQPGDVGTIYERANKNNDAQVIDEMMRSEGTNTAVLYTQYANTVATGYTGVTAFLGGVNGNVVFGDTVNENNQVSHVGGRVEIFHDSEHTYTEPVKHITAFYNKEPYVQAIAVEMDPSFIKQRYDYPFLEHEIYKERVQFNWAAGTKSAKIRMPQITLLQGFSQLFIYAPLSTESRRLEFHTAFGDLFFDIDEIHVRVNEKQCIRGNETESWFFDEFSKIVERKYTFDQWKKRKVIALTPESLAYDGLFEGAKRLYNLSIEFTCKLSKEYEVLMENAADIFSTLAVKTEHVRRQFPKHTSDGRDFIRKLSAEARVVVEYTRKKLTMTESGDLVIDKGLIPTPQPDGLTLRGKTQQTFMRTGGDPNAYLKTF